MTPVQSIGCVTAWQDIQRSDASSVYRMCYCMARHTDEWRQFSLSDVLLHGKTYRGVTPVQSIGCVAALQDIQRSGASSVYRMCYCMARHTEEWRQFSLSDVLLHGKTYRGVAPVQSIGCVTAWQDIQMSDASSVNRMCYCMARHTE